MTIDEPAPAAGTAFEGAGRRLLPVMGTGVWVGAACGAIWGAGAAHSLWLPASLAASPFASAAVGALEGAAVVGALSALGTAVYAIAQALAASIRRPPPP